jgi:hypothetical protein
MTAAKERWLACTACICRSPSFHLPGTTLPATSGARISWRIFIMLSLIALILGAANGRLRVDALGAPKVHPIV